MRIVGLILFFLFSTLGINAQEVGFPLIRNYLPKEFIFSPQVYSAIQDPNGIMYFGISDYGVLEYDGVEWRGIPNKEKSEVYSFAFDKNGRKYITTKDDFGYLDTDNFGKTVYKSLKSLLIDSTINLGSVWNVDVISDTVYFFTERSIYIYSISGNSIISVRPDPETSFYVPFVFNNKYYVLHNKNGIYRLTGEHLYLIPHTTFFSKNIFLKTLPYDDSRILILTRTRGLYLFDPEMKKPIQEFHLESSSDFIQNNNLYTALKLEGKYFLLGSMKKGALLIDQQGRTIQQFNETNLLQNNLILGSVGDFSNNFWLTLSVGISKGELSQDITFWDKNNGLKGNIYDITRFNKTIYIATNQQVYYLSSSKQGNSKGGKNLVSEVKDIPPGQNWVLFRYKIPKSINDDELLLVGAQSGIFEIKGDRAKQIYQGDLHAFQIFQSTKNPYRIYSTDGFTNFISLIYDNGNWKSEGKWIGINDDIRGIIEDSNGDLWLGTFTNGIIHVQVDNRDITKPKSVKYYKKGEGLPSLNGCKPFKLKDKIVFGTEKGLYIHNAINDKLEPFCELNELLCDGSIGIENFVEMPNGNIYLSSKNSNSGKIGYLSPGIQGGYTWNYKPFSRLPEMASILALYADLNGIIWIGSNEGLFRYDPSKDIKNYNLGFNCLIRKISIGKDSAIYWGNEFDSIKQVTNEVNYSLNNIKFNFAAPFFDKEEKTKYSYFLEGFDDTWSDWSTATYKEYTKVKEGNYTFKVRAKNIYDTISTTAEYKITILPPWFRTIWAYLVYGLIVIGVYIFSTRYYSRILISQKLRLEKSVQARTIEIRHQKDEIQSQAEEMASQSKELQEQAKILTQINEELEKLSIVARETDNAIIIMNEKGQFLWVNDGFTRMYGYTMEEFFARYTDIFQASSTKEIKETIQRCIDTKHSIVYESTNRTKSGKIVYTQTTITPVINSLGEIQKLVAIDSDISKLKEAEIEIIQKNEEITSQKEELEKHRNHLEQIVTERTSQLEIAKNKAEESDRLKSAFLANMSHEIRTPMNAIIGFSRFLNNSEILESEKEEFIQLIVNNGNTLLHLIDDIIDIAKIEAGQMTIVRKSCDINELLNSLYTTFLLKKNNYNKNVDLRLVLGVNSLPFNVYTDPLRTQQVISNLLDNALKFTEEGFVEFGYTIEGKSKKPIIKFYVKDTGIGLTKEEQSQIFERFTKIENDNTKLYRGTGLGLAICKNIAKLLEGDIYIESEFNQGSTFFFAIPLIESLNQVESKKAPQMNSVEFNWRGKTLLIAEDENSNFRFIEVLLKKTNIKVLRASNGMEAIQMYSHNPIDVILMDIKMPILDGLEATREIKKINKEIPIIAQTAYAMQNDDIICFEAGCDEYISKPIQPDKLFSLLSKYLH